MKYVKRLITLIIVVLLSTLASAQVGLLQSGGNVIQSTDIPLAVGIFFQAMGGPMASTDQAQVTRTCSTTDAKGSRAAQIVIQAPGYISYREGQARAVTFGGSQILSGACVMTDDDKRVSESLMANLPDAVFLNANSPCCGERRRYTASRVNADLLAFSTLSSGGQPPTGRFTAQTRVDGAPTRYGFATHIPVAHRIHRIFSVSSTPMASIKKEYKFHSWSDGGLRHARSRALARQTMGPNLCSRRRSPMKVHTGGFTLEGTDK